MSEIQESTNDATVTRARELLLTALSEHAVIEGSVALSSGNKAQYYVDAKRALLQDAAFKACGVLVAESARKLGATAVGGLTMGADPVAYSALSVDSSTLKAFSVRKVKKEHGLQRWVEGPLLGEDDKCLVVEDVVTTGASTMRAIERLRQERLKLVGVLCVVDRLVGGGDAIASVAYPAPFSALFSIDEIYPERPDRVISE